MSKKGVYMYSSNSDKELIDMAKDFLSEIQKERFGKVLSRLSLGWANDPVVIICDDWMYEECKSKLDEHNMMEVNGVWVKLLKKTYGSLDIIPEGKWLFIPKESNISKPYLPKTEFYDPGRHNLKSFGLIQENLRNIELDFLNAKLKRGEPISIEVDMETEKNNKKEK